MNKIIILFKVLLVLITLNSCTNEQNKKNNIVNKKSTENSKLSNKNRNIEVLFDDQKFENENDKDLLKELGLGMCNPNEKNLTNYKSPACDPKFFKLFNLKKDYPKKNGFILLVKSNVHDFPLRRTFVFQREGKKLIKVNGFIGNLIGKRENNESFDDLIIRYADKDQNHFNCLYKYRNKRYEFIKIEQINDSNLKAEFQDSMNVEILKWIELNRMQF